MIVFALFFFPPYFLVFQAIHRVYYAVLSGISLIFIVLFFIRWRKNIFIPTKVLLLLVFTFYLMILIPTINNNGTTNSLLAELIIAVGFCSSIPYFFSNKNFTTSISALLVWLEMCVIINLITIIIFPEGLFLVYGYERRYSNPGYFLGHRNNAIEFMIPLICCCNLLNISKCRKKSINYIVVLFVCFITSVLTRSSNEVLCVVVIILFETVLIPKGKLKYTNIFIEYIAFFAFSFALIYLNYITSFMGIIEKVFNKSDTVGTRIWIWGKSIKAILNRPWTGYGAELSQIKYSHIGHANSCHNYFLDIVYYGGIPLLIIISVMFLIMSKSVSQANDSKRSKIFMVITSYLILWLATPIHRDQLFFMFAMFIIIVQFSSFNMDYNTNNGMHKILIRKKR